MASSVKLPGTSACRCHAGLTLSISSRVVARQNAITRLERVNGQETWSAPRFECSPDWSPATY